MDNTFYLEELKETRHKIDRLNWRGKTQVRQTAVILPVLYQ